MKKPTMNQFTFWGASCLLTLGIYNAVDVLPSIKSLWKPKTYIHQHDTFSATKYDSLMTKFIPPQDGTIIVSYDFNGDSIPEHVAGYKY